LVALLSTVFLLSLVVLPTLANTKPRADRVTCMNNLRLIGRAEHIWATDHNDLMPWWVDVSEGGTQHSILQNNAWFNYGVMTNELGTPTILACPSDPGTHPARDFSNIVGGFFHPGNKNNSVSYFIGLHTFLSDAPWRDGYAQGVIQKAMGGDRNLIPDGVNVSCSTGISAAALVSWYGGARWTNAIHGLLGNVLMADGQVTQTSNARLPIAPTPYCVSHVLMPH
jgi:prepilin-type processing-associated H-X9-DG protein